MPLISQISTEGALYLVFEYVQYDLKQFIKSKGKLNTYEVRCLAQQFLEGML